MMDVAICTILVISIIGYLVGLGIILVLVSDLVLQWIASHKK